MKLKYIYLTFIISLFFVSKGFANEEQYKDTIRLNMPNNVIIEQFVLYRKPNDAKLSNTFKKYLEEFLNDFDKIETEGLSEDQPMKIVFKQKINNSGKVNNTLSFTPYSPTTSITIDDKESQLFIDKRIHVLELTNSSKYDDYKILVHFNSIDQLKELLNYDYEAIERNLVHSFVDETDNKKNDHSKALKRLPFTSWVQVNDHAQTEIIYTNYAMSHNNDEIILSANAALNNIKGDWLGSFQTHFAIAFSSKTITKHSVSLSYEWMYNFTTPNEKTVNGFLDIGYSLNTSTNADKEKWYGVEFGYLIDRNGDFFKKNTCRIGFHTKINNGLSIGPQIYFNDFFKDVYPGVNVNISLF